MSEPQLPSPNQPSLSQKLLRAGAAVGLLITAGDTVVPAGPEQAEGHLPAVVAEYTPPQPDNGFTITTLPPETTTTLPPQTTTTTAPVEAVHAPVVKKPDTPDGPDMPQAIIPPEDGPATDPDNPLLNDGNTETLPVPALSAEAAQLMSTETVYIDGNGCSGFLIRDGHGAPIGVATAEHCGFAGYNNPRYTGNDGKTYIVHTPMEAQTGDEQGQMTDIGKLDTFLANSADDKSHDQVFGILEGHTADEVLEAYRQNALSEEQIKSLKLGDTMYLSGWPVYQPDNPNSLQRQSFALNILGTQSVMVTTGETINMLWAAVPKNQYDTECSFGDSGGEGFLLPKDATKPQFVGALGAFNDFTGNVWLTPADGEMARRYFERTFNLATGSLEEYAAVCGFAYESPEVKDENILHTVNSLDEVPGKEGYSLEAVRKRAEDNFFDETKERIVIDGALSFSSKSPDIPPEIYDKIYFYYDDLTQKVVIGWYDEHADKKLLLSVFDGPGFLTFYDHDATPGIAIKRLQGAVTPQAHGFTDSTGYDFGEHDNAVKLDYSKGYEVEVIPHKSGNADYNMIERQSGGMK